MKRKYLTLLNGILSAVAAVGLLAVTITCIVRINRVAEVIQDTTDELGGVKLLAYAGLGYLVAILGIVISMGLAGYRATLAYYYIKIYISDEEFYAARKKGIYGFTALTVVMLAVLTLAYFLSEGLIDGEVRGVIAAFAVLYLLLAILSPAERFINAFLKKREIKKKGQTGEGLNKESIAKELDKLAEETAEREIKREENKNRKNV